MIKLTGLPGCKSKTTNAKFFNTPLEIDGIIKSGFAATTADAMGAINIWKDDEGFIRCEVQRYMRIMDKAKYKRISSVISWTNKWLKFIK